MRLTDAELAYVRSLGLFITKRCDSCGKVLNQTFRYTMPDRPETWCSRSCQDKAMGWDGAVIERKASARPASYLCVCQKESCGRQFTSARKESAYCSERCSQWERRKLMRDGRRQEQEASSPR